MKCSNPDCNRGIGLIDRRGWFTKRCYCSRNCRDVFMADLPKRLDQEQSASTYFERLFFATDWESTAEVAASGHPHKAR
jgi:hypothetical protein